MQKPGKYGRDGIPGASWVARLREENQELEFSERPCLKRKVESNRVNGRKVHRAIVLHYHPTAENLNVLPKIMLFVFFPRKLQGKKSLKGLRNP